MPASLKPRPFSASTSPRAVAAFLRRSVSVRTRWIWSGCCASALAPISLPQIEAMITRENLPNIVSTTSAPTQNKMDGM